VVLELAIIQRAIIGGIMAGFATALIGVFVVKMNLSSIGYCMSHAAFAGAALGVALSLDPLYTALGFSAFMSLIIGPLSDKARLHADVIIGVLFSLNMALAFIFMSLFPQRPLTREAVNVLWGSILAIKQQDLYFLAAVLVATLVAVKLTWKELQAIMYNRKLAEADGINTKPYVYAVVFLTGLVVTLGLKLVGGLLVFALLFNPASACFQVLDDLKKIVALAPVLGALSCLLGLFLSLAVDWPVGSCIAVVSTLILLVAVAISPKRRVVSGR